uniref:protein-serine/threonine phosphatase n=1 Tax=Marchantia polymorpha TaxID=3197 RepID=D3W6X9_MARPO|nr:protein phosphtase 2C [Marchantia polymorpha]
METLVTSDACRSSCNFLEDSLQCETATVAARRRRKEIRRFKLITNAGISEPSSKRFRALECNAFPLAEGDGVVLSRRPNCNLALIPSKQCADTEERTSESRQTLGCPHGRQGVRSSLSTWERTSLGISVQSTSSGEEDSGSSNSGSTSSGSSVSSDSSGTSLESTDAEAGSTVTWTLDNTGTVSLTESQLEVQAATTMLQSQETSVDRLKVSAARNFLDVEDTTMIPSSSGSVNVIDDGHCPPHGLVSVCGRRREMEDAVAAVPAFLSVPCDVTGCNCRENYGVHAPLHFFGVYDGHGGSQAAVFCADRLHHALAEEMKTVLNSGNSRMGCSQGNWDLQWRKAMSACFLRMDAEVGGVPWKVGQADSEAGSSKCSTDAIAPETVGSTAVVAVVGSSQIIVANCGDSRAVLSRGGRAIALSKDHKPEREDEMARVEAAGGRVIFWNGYRVLGVLAMSRAIGDRYLKPFVIAEPEVTCTVRSEDDECLILASDGLWDVLSNELVCEIARKCLIGRRNSDLALSVRSGLDEETGESPASVAAALLTKLALARGSSDNISVVVVDLTTGSSA